MGSSRKCEWRSSDLQLWEIGVIVSPDLFADDYPGVGGECAGEGMVEMVPCFKQDLPLLRLLVEEPDKPQGSIIKKQEQDLLGDGKSRLPAAVVGFRMTLRPAGITLFS